MISFFPDVNVWIALSVEDHVHHAQAWSWLRGAPDGVPLTFSRYTQVGLLRLLTNQRAMGEQTLSIPKAWALYDRWTRDPRFEFCAEPKELEWEFRRVTQSFGSQPASKSIGDCYLLAFAKVTGCRLVTFDKALGSLAERHGHSAVVPG
jgi:toxin-antitoxin system PIN domain toxin